MSTAKRNKKQLLELTSIRTLSGQGPTNHSKSSSRKDWQTTE